MRLRNSRKPLFPSNAFLMNSFFVRGVKGHTLNRVTFTRKALMFGLLSCTLFLTGCLEENEEILSEPGTELTDPVVISTPTATPSPSVTATPTVISTPMTTVTPTPTPTPKSTPTPEPTAPPVTGVDCSDMQTFMLNSDLNCTVSGCHSASPSQAAKIALTGTIDDLALRLGDVTSVNSNCAGEKVIDLSNPSNSLLLKIIDPDSGVQCATKMPIGGPALSPEHFQCFEQWVDDIASLAVVPVPPEIDPFESVSGFSALNKVKSILHGGAVTDEDMERSVTASGGLAQAELKTQIEEWMTTGEFEKKFRSFLQLSLQQKNVNTDNIYFEQFINLNGGVLDANKLRANFEESFVKTTLRIINANQDFRNIARARNWEVTTAMLVALSHADYPRSFAVSNRIRDFDWLCGDTANETGCDGIDDYSDWRTVSLKQGSDPAPYSNTKDLVDTLRGITAGGELALLAPRIGFFTTPVFFQSWESNVGNKFRVTANQAMIVGLGLSFEAGDVTPSGNLAALDEEHAGEDNPECYACHRMLDPMTQVFDNAYTVTNSRALASPKNTAAAFAFHGGEKVLNSVDDLGQAIYEHPNFAKGWVGKLCNWATSAPCNQSSAEFLRLVEFFKNSNYRMKPLLVEMFASPLVTGAEYTDAFEESSGPGVVLNRKNHFCTTMKVRLDQYRESLGLEASPLTDICNYRSAAAAKAALLPEDEFARGSVNLVQAVNVDPFLTTGYKQLCESVGTDMVRGNAGVEGTNYNYIFNSNQVDASIAGMVTYVMGLPPASEQHNEVKTVFRKVYDVNNNSNSCEDAGLDPVTANEDDVECGLDRNTAESLRAVWVLACSAPSSMGMGF